MSRCEFCDAEGSVVSVKTYKHLWLACDACGNYRRSTRDSYPLAPIFDSKPIRSLPKGAALSAAFGHKPDGVDYYRYYEDILKAGDPKHWADEFQTFHAEMEEHGISLAGKSMLDVSGEPGFFAKSATAANIDVTVTAFADNVAGAITKHLDVPSFKFDFNSDDLTQSASGAKFDIICVRNAISFCEALPDFVTQAKDSLKPGGRLYILFSPPSRGMLLRWMLDDYTYLRLYTPEHIRRVAEAAGLHFDWQDYHGRYHWAKDVHPALKAARIPYQRDPFFRSASDYQMHQHTVSLMFQRPV